jgi:formylglycine-generating enzyme required for sulfatase activity
MGSAAGSDNELPVHGVTFSHDIWMSETEVTQADYDALMSASYDGYFTPSWNATYGAGDDYPAYEVSWSDAVLYCNARSRAEGLDSVYTYIEITGTPGSLSELVGVTADLSRNGYRLPTEAEWEFAYRGGVMQDYYWGADYDPYPATAADSLDFDDHAVWYGNSWVMDVDLGYGTHPVRSKPANPYGLYDMAGNVYEWCHDWFGDYASTAQTDPVGPDSGEYHTLRGGSWANLPIYLRATNRTFHAPCYYYYLLGFRVARTITGSR